MLGSILLANTNTVSTGSYNTVINPAYNMNQGVTTGSNNVVIGSAVVANNLTNSVVISDNNGTIALTKSSNNTLTADTQTNALIIADVTGKAIVTKEYLPQFYTDSTTITLSSATLTSTYPNATIGSEVHALNITLGGVIYKKTATGWATISAVITT